MNTANRFPRRAAGMALIAVLWIVAALSIMVTGLVYTVRQQIGIVTTAREQISGQALGEAAIALTMQGLLASTDRQPGTQTVTVNYAGVEMAVEFAPLNGLISLNGAPAPLLASMLRTAGGLDQGRAEALAQAIVEWRDGIPQIDATVAGAVAMRQRKFEATEDLMLVPGVDYPLYSRIAPLVSADLLGGSQVNPQAASPEVLAVLAQGDMNRVAQYLAQRANSGQMADASGLSNAGSFGGRADAYRLRVRVPLDAGKILLLTSDIALQGGRPGSAPWRALRTSRQIVASSAGA